MAVCALVAIANTDLRQFSHFNKISLSSSASNCHLTESHISVNMISIDVTWQSLGTTAYVLDRNINLVLSRLSHYTLYAITHPVMSQQQLTLQVQPVLLHHILVKKNSRYETSRLLHHAHLRTSMYLSHRTAWCRVLDSRCTGLLMAARFLLHAANPYRLCCVQRPAYTRFSRPLTRADKHVYVNGAVLCGSV